MLFWNVGGLNRSAPIASLARHLAADVVALAECDHAAEVLRELNRAGDPIYFPAATRSRVTLFSVRSERFFPPLGEHRHYSIRHYLSPLPGRAPLVIALAHLRSRLRAEPRDLEEAAVDFAADIRRAEAAAGHPRTLVIGDLNMDPFEPGVVGSRGLHAVMTETIARRESRTVRGEERPFFYNPMWRFLGDKTPGPPGSYYFDRSESMQHFWHTFDQVLLRPALLPPAAEYDVEVIDRLPDGSRLAKNSGRPDVTVGSDHFPIVCRLRDGPSPRAT